MSVVVRFRTLFLLLACLLVIAACSQSNQPKIAKVHDAGLFELDGNAFAAVGVEDDWSCLFSNPLNTTNCQDPPTPISSAFTVDVFNIPNGDNIFGGGQKDIQDLSSLTIDPAGSAPDKDDLENAAFATYQDANNHAIVYFTADRFSNTGDAFLGFWFFKNKVSINPNNTYNGLHSNGDILVVADNKSVKAFLSVFQWDNTCASAQTAGCADTNLRILKARGDADCTTAAGDAVCATFNTADGTPSAWPFTPKSGSANTYKASEFFEGGIDLTQVLNGNDCFSAVQVESRASESTDAQLKDLILLPLNTCGTIKVVKDAVPNDAQDFGFAAGSPNPGFSLTPATFNLDDDADATLSNIQEYLDVKAGTYTVTENANPSGWSLTNIVCTDPAGNDTTVDLATRKATINVARGEIVTCTFTNTKNATIIVKKVMVGGTDSFSFTGTPNGSINTNNGTIQTSVTPGQYVSTETVTPGWILTSVTCDDSGSATPSVGSVANANATFKADPGETVTCTFTNAKKPQLTLVKNVINNNGGTKTVSDFPLSAAGPTPITNQISGTAGATNVSVDAGTYTLSEQPQAGYTASATGYSCVKNGGAAVNGNSITLANGDNATCTINNDDQPAKLTLVKVVTNDDGGTKTITDFPLTATGPTTITGVSATAAVTNASVNAGSYTLSETTQSDYTASDYSCVKNGGQPVSGNSISLANGDAATCTITNNDKAAQLIVIKHVINDNGGTKVAADFPITVTGNTPSPASFAGVESPGTTVAIKAGAYSVAETIDPGYAASYSADCTGSIALGQTKTCTITNDDKAPKLHLRKTVINNNGGTATVADFTLTADGAGSNDLSGTSPVDSSATLKADTWALSETNVAGYSASAWVCVGGNQVGSNITVGLGGEATCTITNDDQPAHLKLVKTVTNDNGGTAVPADFKLTATGPTPLSGQGGAESDVNPGSYNLSETNLPGYAAGSWSCVGGTQNGASVTLALGQSATCTINNNDIGAKLTLVKTVINDNGGTKTAADFPRFIDGNAVSWGVAVDLNAGPHTASETPQTGYTASNWGGDCAANGSVTLALGDNKTCTITNDDQPAHLTLVKIVTNNNGGTRTVTDFPLSAVGPTPITGQVSGTAGATNVAVNAGNYTLSEASKSDYTASDYSCVKNGSAAVVGNSITLALNDSATCTITNDDKPSFIVINKLSKGATGTFGFSISGPTPSSPNITTSGTPNGQGTTGSIPVNAGAYTVNESGLPAGWKLDASKCTVDGTTDFGTPTIVGGVNVSWAFTLPLGTTVTCTFDNGKTAVATRTQGFWSTHTGLSNTTWNTLVPDAAKTLCNAPITAIAQPGQNQLMGGFWSNIAKKSTAVKRLDIDQARMQMLQQYLAAVLNVYYFGSGSVAMLDAARTAYCATDINAIKAQVGILGSFNTSGDSILFTPGVSATAQASKSQANIPFWDNPTTH